MAEHDHITPAPNTPAPVAAGVGGSNRTQPPRLGSGYPQARTIRRALNVLERLPTEALADLTERLVDRLDAAEPDCDLELEEDCCAGGECGGVALRGDRQPGDPTDAEDNGDAEPDDGDRDGDRDLTAQDEPLDGRLRAERDGFVQVHRRPFVAVRYREGRPVRVDTVVWERRA